MGDEEFSNHVTGNTVENFFNALQSTLSLLTTIAINAIPEMDICNPNCVLSCAAMLYKLLTQQM